MYVVAHIRGGGERGMKWFKGGQGAKNKMNAVNDLISAAEYFQNKGLTDKDHTGIEGGSNGGCMTAAATVKRPDLFKVVFSRVPVTDMLRFHHFTIGNSWIAEYGVSDIPEDL